MALYAFDGTWNVRDSKETVEYVQSPQYGVDRAARRDTVETNVHRFMEFYGAADSEYVQGVGTRFGVVGRVLGGAFGFGGRHRVRRMYRALTERYFAGDTRIDIVGFSRGAALAVHFANVLAKHGLRNPANKRHFAWWYYPELGWTFRHPKPSDDDVSAPPIAFLGLWDTVATFGIPVRPFRNRSRKWMVWEVPEIASKSSFHAMALDEVRATFALVRPRRTLYEVWFRGVHSNIGGGYLDRGLSDIALAWMMEMAVWAWHRAKLPIPELFTEALDQLDPEPGGPPDWGGLKLETLEPDPNGTVARPRAVRSDAWREVPEDALVHHAALLRKRNVVSDHLGSNRAIVRRIPGSARAVADPPSFYSGTRLEAARRLATEAYARVPVRPRPWLKVRGHFAFRSDDWIVLGTELGRTDPDGWVERTTRASFENIAVAWMLAGRPNDPAAVSPIGVVHSGKGARPAPDQRAVVKWVVEMLHELAPYLPTSSGPL